MQRANEDAQNDYQQQQAEIAQRILQKMAPVIDKFAKTISTACSWTFRSRGHRGQCFGSAQTPT